MKRIFYEICKDKQDTLAIIDFNGDIITANKKFHEITFIADRSVKKLNIFQLVDKSYHKQIRERLGQLEKGNPTQPMEYKLIDKAGGSTYVEMSSQPVTYHNKKAIVTRIRNISHHKEMEKKLYEAIIQTEEKEKQRFAQDLHDELGPFLSGIKLYIDEIELFFLWVKN